MRRRHLVTFSLTHPGVSVSTRKNRENNTTEKKNITDINKGE